MLNFAPVSPVLKSTLADIRIFPKKINTVGLDARFILGDLHANTLKLLYFAIHTGLAILSQEDYKLFSTLMRKMSELWRENDIENIRRTLSNLKKNPLASGKITLIGDTLADRGENDFPTLLLYKQLEAINIPFNVILSNHDIEFILRFEKQKLETPIVLLKEHCASLSRLNLLLSKKKIAPEEIKILYENHYRPSLKLIDYALEKNGIVLISHGLMGINTIESLAKKFNVPYQDETPQALANTIDRINQEFKKYAERNEIHTLVDPKILDKAYSREDFDADQYPIEFTLWNRSAENILRPAVHKGYPLWFVHGHDGTLIPQNNVCNLDFDNELGQHVYTSKSESMTHWKSELKYLRTHGLQLSEQLSAAVVDEHAKPFTPHHESIIDTPASVKDRIEKFEALSNRTRQISLSPR